MRDPFADKKRPWRLYLFLLVLFAVIGGLWQQGYVTQWWEALRAKTEQAASEAQPAPAAPAAPAAEPAKEGG
jgi:hypothetical protein